MLKISSRFVATAASFVALLGVCSVASASPYQHHEVRKLEAKLGRLQAKKGSELAHHHMRAAARTQVQIDATRAQIAAIRHH